MKKLSDLSLLKDEDKANIAKKISALNPKLDTAPAGFIKEMITLMEAREKRPLRTRIIGELRSGAILPIFSLKEFGTSLIYLPVWASKINAQAVGVANLSNRFKMDKKGEINSNPKQFYNLCAAALIFREMSVNPELFVRNSRLATALALIYSRVMVKCVDKMHGISFNELVLDQIRYAFAKFFLVGCLERTSDATNIAIKAVKTSSRLAVVDIDRLIPPEAYKDLGTFIPTLAGVFNNLKGLSMKSLVAELVKTYGATSLLMPEHPPMLVINILLAIWDSNINNSYAWNSVIEKDGEAVLTEVDNIVK
jgi:hypothetical protein